LGSKNHLTVEAAEHAILARGLQAKMPARSRRRNGRAGSDRYAVADDDGGTSAARQDASRSSFHTFPPGTEQRAIKRERSQAPDERSLI
jgi:hypothetical protein